MSTSLLDPAPSYIFIYIHWISICDTDISPCAKCKHSCTKLLTSIDSVQKCIKPIQTFSSEAQKHGVCTALLFRTL